VTESEDNDANARGNGAAPEGDDSLEMAEPEVRPEDEPATDPEPEPDPLEVAKAEVARIRDQLMRTAADFDNFRKRSRREVSEAETRGRDEVFRELLPVFDNLERAVQHAEGTTDVQALADGIRMVLKQFLDTLGRLGIERVSAVGQPFDPSLHEAIQHMVTTEHPPGTIAAEAQPGYRQGDRLVRPALVVVAKAPPDGES
jgi:molecular chaperone GrpE